MATSFLSTTNPFYSSPPSSSFSSNQTQNIRQLVVCKAIDEPSSPNSSTFTKRSLSVTFISSLVPFLAGKDWFFADAAILEAEDDEELLERVKNDRKKRLEKQGVINSSNKETGYLQDLVYQLSKVGQAIDKNDLPTASSVLGGSTNADWVQKANIAFAMLSSSPEEKSQVDTFNSSLASLISSVTGNDVESSKSAFVSSAAAFEKWTAITGLAGKLKGL